MFGLAIGALSFLIIGIFHPIVIKAEYHIGAGIWPAFLVAGLASMVGSIIVDTMIIKCALGLLAFTLFWSIKELKDQKKRVEKGWFPKKGE